VSDYANDFAGTLVNLAKSKNNAGKHTEARDLLVKARRYHEQVLAANPANPGYRRFFRNNLEELCPALLGLADHAATAAAAEELARFAYEPGPDAYNAACFTARCIPLVAKDARVGEAQRHDLARRYADRAVELLRQAVRHGWLDAVQTRKDSDLDPLRNRDDFRELVAELEEKAKARQVK
jgi:hypothetical protein